MRTLVMVVAAVVVAIIVAASTGPGVGHAQLLNDISHLKLTSSASHGSPGDHVDQVINIDLDVRISIHDPVANLTDWGILALRPGDTPDYTWTCTSCGNGYFVQVHACDQAGGCTQGDVEYWLVGVKVNIGGVNPTSYVRYDIDSDDLGDGYRHHVSPANCSTLVTPKDDTYYAIDSMGGWDNATYCTDAGVSINVEYE
jgi:hypothetical protein